MPSDDIVKYLRLSRTRFNRHAEAADEIERLRHRLWVWRKLADEMANCLDSSTETSDLLANYEQAVRGE